MVGAGAALQAVLCKCLLRLCCSQLRFYSTDALCSHSRGPNWVFQGCIEWLRAYVDFAKHHGLGPKNGKLRLELRDETDPYYPGQIHHRPPAKKVSALHCCLGRALSGALCRRLLTLRLCTGVACSRTRLFQLNGACCEASMVRLSIICSTTRMGAALCHVGHQAGFLTLLCRSSGVAPP